MANPNPTPRPENLTPWAKGQPGNPAGHSAGRRVTAALVKLIEAKQLDDALATTWLAAAIGDPKLLQGRRPNYAFFRELLDRIEGKVPERVEADLSGGLTIEVTYADGAPDAPPPPPGPAGDLSDGPAV